MKEKQINYSFDPFIVIMFMSGDYKISFAKWRMLPIHHR